MGNHDARLIRAAREKRERVKAENRFMSWDTLIWMVVVLCEKILAMLTNMRSNINSVKSTVLEMKYETCRECEKRRRRKKWWFKR